MYTTCSFFKATAYTFDNNSAQKLKFTNVKQTRYKVSTFADFNVFIVYKGF